MALGRMHTSAKAQQSLYESTFKFTNPDFYLDLRKVAQLVNIIFFSLRSIDDFWEINENVEKTPHFTC